MHVCACLAVCRPEWEAQMQLNIESQAGTLGPPFSCPEAFQPMGLAILNHLKTQQKEQRKVLVSL